MRRLAVVLTAFLLALFATLEIMGNIALFNEFVLRDPRMVALSALIFMTYFIGVMILSEGKYKGRYR